jgi:hypothetical protein
MKKTTTINPEALAEIPIHIVAGIAAQIQSAEGPTERIRQAYDLLDAAESARGSLILHSSTHEGLEEFWIYRYKEERRPVLLAEMKADPLYREEAGKALPVPFDEALAAICGKSIKKNERARRFELYFTEREEGLEKFTKQLPFFAPFLASPPPCELIARLKSDGIPFGDYKFMKGGFPEWWKRHLSRLQSAKRKGKTKDETKDETKGQQGRVVRRGDKRKGSSRKKTLRKKKKNP